jgi:predicted GNAT family N-acyltransferase
MFPATPQSVAFQIRTARWPEDEAAIAAVRWEVFIAEQGVPEALEWEERDGACQWFLAVAGEQVAGIARLTPEGRIGRMAVRRPFRGRGVGSALLRAVLDAAQVSGCKEVVLSAQTHAMPFYAQQGFQAEGPEYLDAGIPHRTMRLNLEELA